MQISGQLISDASPVNVPSASSAAADGPPFGDAMKAAIDGINDLQQQASTSVSSLIRGSGVDVHDAMIATQKADMAFELALSVRNKAVAAYQQLMSMQF